MDLLKQNGIYDINNNGIAHLPAAIMFQHPDVLPMWTGENAKDEQPYSLMQLNGRKVLSPPKDWLGPPPSSACELYVRHIPKDLNEQKLIQPFLRFGRIYEIRLPMDFNQANRGYAYIKYTNEEDAACAMEVISHLYVEPHRKLEILHSYEKCRLFVSNIPRHLSESEIEAKFRSVFPTLERIYTRGGGGGNNRARFNPSSRQTLYIGNGENGVPPSSSMELTDGGGGGDGLEGDGDADSGIQHETEMCGLLSDDDAASRTLGNRGHAFIQFPTHMQALEAKKSTTPGLIRLWDRDLKVVWANNDRNADMSKETKTLFVRNVELSVNNRDIIDLLVQHVPRVAIRKISKVRTTAFLDFTTRESAEKCLQKLQGTVLHGQCLDVEWAKPSEQQSLHRMRNTDFDVVLRLKCIANGWQIPVVLFGTNFEAEALQYATVMLRDGSGLARAIFCILHTHELVDVQSRLCEVVCVLIETIGQFPDYNYLFDVLKDSAHLLGMITHNAASVDFIASYRVPAEFHFDLNEIVDLSWAVATLAAVNEDSLLLAYHDSFRSPNVFTYLQHWLVLGHRIFGSIYPKYRNKAPLKHNLNNAQIVLALCYVSTGTNRILPTRPYLPIPVSQFDSGYERLSYVTLKLLPIALTQSRFAVSHVLSSILFDAISVSCVSSGGANGRALLTGCGYTTAIRLQAQRPPLQQLQRQQ